ncbi:PfkB family carbohydrate kinase [Mycobacteroides immunogenum]|uniref:Fructokinase n=1 Tax=Mycobacteroides immunogenum TaxID=83262 RepID=A0A7V8LQD9_9MYCO|nr:PfkB family carbohydrate kinase [Mycobacteroides immunogenum]AMT69354.1 fructokinase [Mycobacteroides immunogenum]ANO02391.1 fructokinase [Mycobacteroides immunogenum]KIU39613.1 fructokinase [Mycobacteroides immunogenum]KPG08505.1 fructokinase [Mycobacteroides immunogenum]KPG08757.1 fructokinase [Mycobacteroides immunogenum]
MASGGSIVVCGETLVDLVPATGGLWRPVPGGGPYNTAIAAAKLGAPAALLTHVSRDAFGRQCVQKLAEAGVDQSLVMRHELPATLAVADIDENGTAQYQFYWRGTANDVVIKSLPDPVDAPVAIWAGSIASVLWSERDEVRAWILRHYADIPLTFDVNVRPTLIADRETYAERLVPWLSIAQVARASTDDLEYLYPGVSVRDTVGGWFDEHPRIEIAVITCGSEGSLAFRRGEPSPLHVPAHPVTVVDTVGAGDTYSGAFLDGFYRSRLDLPEALHRAAVAAAITCTRHGAQPPDAVELANELRRTRS